MADDNVEALVEEWGEDNVQAAFWLSQHIKEQGLDGIGYMKAAENHLHSTGDFTVQRKLETKMNGDY